MDNEPIIITNILDTISSSLCGFKQLKRILYQHQIYPNELRTSHYEYSTRNELQTTNHSSAKYSIIAKIDEQLWNSLSKLYQTQFGTISVVKLFSQSIWFEGTKEPVWWPWSNQYDSQNNKNLCRCSSDWKFLDVFFWSFGLIFWFNNGLSFGRKYIDHRGFESLCVIPICYISASVMPLRCTQNTIIPKISTFIFDVSFQVNNEC